MKSAREIIEEGMTQTSSVIEEKKEQKQVVVQINQGQFDFSNQQELANAAQLAIKLKLVPQHLIKEGVEGVMTCLTVVKALKLEVTALQKMFYYKGNVSVYGVLYNALCERNPNFGDKKEYWIDESYNKICLGNKNLGKEWAAVVEIKRKGQSEFSAYYFSKEDATKAKLLPATKYDYDLKKTVPNPDSPWEKYTKDMMMWKARKRAYDANYSESLMGIDCYEDMREVYESRDVTPENKSHAGELNALVE